MTLAMRSGGNQGQFAELLSRASNTQPALIVRGESDHKEGLDSVKQVISDTLSEIGGVEVNWEHQGE